MCLQPKPARHSHETCSLVPRGKQLWVRTHFRIAAIHEQIEIGGKVDPRTRLDEKLAAQVRPLMSAKRERRAQGINAPCDL